jgi:hypothetical protein
VKHQAKHFFYASGWKKFEPLWNFVIRARQLGRMTPVLEAVLSKVSHSESEAQAPSPSFRPGVALSPEHTVLAPEGIAPPPEAIYLVRPSA